MKTPNSQPILLAINKLQGKSFLKQGTIDYQ
jgi:hypothetical protein